MSLMVCASCGRRVDPTRSFCTNCGSSVFADESERPRLFPRSSPSSSASASASSALRQIRSLRDSAASLDRSAIINATKVQAPTALRVGGLIRFAVFVLLIWFAVNWLLDIPEVVALKVGMQHGRFNDEDVRAAQDAVLARIDAALGRAAPERISDTSTEVRASNPMSRPAPASAENRALPASSRVFELSDVTILAAPPSTRPPPGVSLTGNGVSMPRVLHVETPILTPQTRRVKIEGTLVLHVVVRTHGEAGEITVVRSIEPRLDEQAIAAVRQWRFAPALRGGQPIPVLVRVEIPFSTR